MKNKFYITTPIYYVNAAPHLGSAYTTIAADVLARYYRGKYGAENVFMMTGTDEHGAKIQEIAEASNKTPKAFTDSVVKDFQTAWKNLNIDYDGFVRTTDKHHEEAVAWVTQKLYDQGDIYKGSYEALYCVGCEQYKTKSELLEGDICPDHNRKCEIHEEDAYLFALSKYQNQLETLISNDSILIRPESRKNEVLSFIRGGLDDIAISRKKEKVSWGIDLPFDNTQTTYVWIDAFLNYLTGLGWPEDKKQTEKFWPADVQLMAKDIIRVHATIWQAMLLALDLPTTKQLFVHGYFTINGKKMSKSLGNVLEPNDLVKKFGADAVRYAVLREFPFGEDGDISEEKIMGRYNSDLANGVGNLFNRVLTLAEMYFDSKVPAVNIEETGNNFQQGSVLHSGGRQTFLSLQAQYQELENLRFDRFLIFCVGFDQRNDSLGVVPNLNRYIELVKLWDLVKIDKERASVVIYDILEVFRLLSVTLYPIMPEISSKIRHSLSLEPIDAKTPNIAEEFVWGQLKPQSKLEKPEPLFPRLEKTE